MRLLTFLFLLFVLAASAQDKVGVTAVITVDADRNYGMGHPGNNADYIQQLRNVTLPVSLISFDVKGSTDAITIEWKTASEKNSSHFIIKRSGEDRVFVNLAEIQAQTESSTTSFYKYIDRSPLNGYNYYQLEQVDVDGTSTLSKIIATAYNLKEREIYTYFSDQAVLNVIVNGLNQNDPIKVTIATISGQILTSKSIKISETNHYVFNDLFLNSGIYILTIESKDQLISQKIIK